MQIRSSLLKALWILAIVVIGVLLGTLVWSGFPIVVRGLLGAIYIGGTVAISCRTFRGKNEPSVRPLWKTTGSSRSGIVMLIFWLIWIAVSIPDLLTQSGRLDHFWSSAIGLALLVVIALVYTRSLVRLLAAERAEGDR